MVQVIIIISVTIYIVPYAQRNWKQRRFDNVQKILSLDLKIPVEPATLMESGECTRQSVGRRWKIVH